MPTTSNFGWTTPADTDLVKDGAAAIRTLGNGIDTSFLDLKGGTTDQVLAKNSNTDLDFKWVAPTAGDIEGVTAGTGISGGGTSGTVTITNSMATAIDAKGDLVVGTGADTFARLAVGTNGHILVADSAETTGLKWAAPSSGPTHIGCKLYKTSAQSIPNASFTVLTFDSEVYDTDGFHSTSSNTERITIPTGKGGKYGVFWQVGYAGNGTGYRNSYIGKNGSTAAFYGNIIGVPSADSFFSLNYTTLDLAAGDYIQMYTGQTSGGNLNTQADAAAGPTFGVTYLGA